MAAFSAGILFSWSSPSIPILIAEDGPYRFTLEQCSYLTVIPPISTIFCSLIYADLIDKIGRKYGVLLMGIPQITSLLLTAFARNIYVFYVARAIAGIGDAGLFLAMPSYIGEIASPAVRGTWGNCLSFSIYAGQFVVNLIGGYTSVRNTALICLCFPLLFVCTFSFVPESPYYYMMRGKREEAGKALTALRRTQKVETELLQVESDVKRQMSEPGTWKDLFMIRSNRKALIAGIFLRWSQQLSGISSFAVYTQYIFKHVGGSLSATDSAIIFQGSLAVGNFLASFFIDKIGRRSSMMYSLLCCSVCTGGITVFLYISYAYPEIDLSSFQWVPLAGMLLYVAFYSFGIGIVPTLMLGELFSASIKGKGLCALMIAFAINISLVTKVFQLMHVHFGLYAPFALFSICSFLSTFFTYWLVPETKGKTLEEIQQILKGVEGK